MASTGRDLTSAVSPSFSTPFDCRSTAGSIRPDGEPPRAVWVVCELDSNFPLEVRIPAYDRVRNGVVVEEYWERLKPGERRAFGAVVSNGDPLAVGNVQALFIRGVGGAAKYGYGIELP